MRISRRRLTRICVLLTILACSAPPPNNFGLANPNQGSQKTETREPVKRALLIGIGVYQPKKADEKPKDQGIVRTETANRQPASGARGGGRAAFSNLDGPRSDVAAMREVLTKKYGFTVIDTLEDQKATRAAILAAIKKNLIDDATQATSACFTIRDTDRE